MSDDPSRLQSAVSAFEQDPAKGSRHKSDSKVGVCPNASSEEKVLQYSHRVSCIQGDHCPSDHPTIPRHKTSSHLSERNSGVLSSVGESAQATVGQDRETTHL